jgi:tRNA modification GTPase
MNLLDTIAAISTPYGKGGIAVLRISGADALGVAERVFEPIGKKGFEHARAVYGGIFSSAEGKRVQIDDGIAVYFRAPMSFTGEDTVEISCHGGILVTQRVLEAILCAGARMAMAGEFTKRAFINGKMSLTSTEALGDLLDASTTDQIKLARSGMKGNLSVEIGKIYDSLCNVLAALYAHIDYPDEDLADISRDEMLDAANGSREHLERLAKTYSTGHAVGEGVATVIVGRTNAGKSTLYNRIVGRDAAIVTDIEGTTRDVLTEKATLGKVTLRLSDTAGLRNSDDRVEQIGIDRARREAESAELILAVFDASHAPDESDLALVGYLSSLGGVKIAVLNKSDVGICSEAQKLADAFDYSVCISAQSGEGFDRLVETVENVYIDHALDVGSDAIIANARQNSSVISSKDALDRAIAAIENDLPLEVCCVEIENALAALGELDGKTVSEDIVARIFAHFCVGK